MLKTSHLLTLSLVLLPMAVNAESYKCRAPDGKITYAGQMSLTPGVKCELMFVKKPPANLTEPIPAETSPEKPAEDSAIAGKPVEKSAADKELETKRKKIEADEAKKKADKVAEDKLAEQKMKAENCQNAKNNLQTYSYGARIGKINEKGEREFLDDADIKQKAEQAQKDVEKWCSS